MTSASLNVLVVTADADAAWYAGAGLTGRGFVVRVAGGADAALRSATEVPPDVVLMDFETPGVDGVALAWALRDRPRDDRAPLLVVAIRGFAVGAASPAVDLSLPRHAPSLGGLVAGVLGRFREFLTPQHFGASSPPPAEEAFPERRGAEPAQGLSARLTPDDPSPAAWAPQGRGLRCSVS